MHRTRSDPGSEDEDEDEYVHVHEDGNEAASVGATPGAMVLPPRRSHSEVGSMTSVFIARYFVSGLSLRQMTLSIK